MIEIRALTRADFGPVAEALPLERFDGWDEGWTYLVAWEDGSPVGHAYVAWTGTELGLPELQDVYVLPERRGRGVGTALTMAAEQLAAEQGHRRCSLSVSEENEGARRLYERLGYQRAAHPPQRIQGTIMVRSGPLEVDDTLLYFTKRIG